MFGRKRTYIDAASGVAGNPSSAHAEGRAAKRMLEDARTALARLIEVQADDVVFTSGATESNALAILGHIRALRAKGTEDIHVLYLPSAHASLVKNAELLAKEGVAIEPLPIRDMRVDTDALKTLLRETTALVAMEAVCGETGIVWNTREVRTVLEAARPRGPKIQLHVDASQAPWTEKLTRDHFGADLMSLDASKVAPTHGMGVLIAHRTIPLAPLYEGGGQERGLRPGTEAPELAQAFARALSRAAAGRATFRAQAADDRKHLVELLAGIPDIHITEAPGAEGSRQAPNILNLAFPGRDTDYLAALLDEAGFAVSTRSACETDSETGSSAVFALTGDATLAQSTLRVSWGPLTRRRDLERFAQALAREIAFVDSAGSR